jgi:hypothetical protein
MIRAYRHDCAGQREVDLDPVTLIVAALAAGAASGLKDTAGQAVKDAYGALKSLVKGRLGEASVSDSVVERHEEAPEVYKRSLETELAKAGVTDDEEVVRAAQRLLALVDPVGAQAGKYEVTISGSKGTVVGDHAHVTMTFNDES